MQVHTYMYVNFVHYTYILTCTYIHLPLHEHRLGLTTKLYTMNPKAVTVVELYGILDPITRDWTDGLLSNIFREINRPTEKNERKYILFDGDVDALWVENMNSVMDDNKLLTLANGERIRLQKHCALLVEVVTVIITAAPSPCWMFMIIIEGLYMYITRIYMYEWG